MGITKDIENLEFDDIKSLMNNQIPESDILDYREDMIDDDDLIKLISAFANSRGGHIVFGVTKSSKGGYPSAIQGIDFHKINKEKIEQLVLSNIFPKIQIFQKTIDVNDKKFLIIQIPISTRKPHFNNMSHRFYKRFQFEIIKMTEQEIYDSYRNRLMGKYRSMQFAKKIYNNGLKSTPDGIKSTIIIMPAIIEDELIKTTDFEKFESHNSIILHPDTFYAKSKNFLPQTLESFSDGLISKNFDEDQFRQISIHRNGCIHYIDGFIYKTHIEKHGFSYMYFAVKLMQSLQFASHTLRRYGYLDDVKILVRLDASANTKIQLDFLDLHTDIDKIHCKVKRVHSLSYIESNYEKISSSILDQIFNYCGFDDKCDIFDENGKIIPVRIYPPLSKKIRPPK